MDSWEQEAGQPADALSDKFATFNVDAPVFVPGMRYDFSALRVADEPSFQSEPEPKPAPPVIDAVKTIGGF